MKIMSAKLLNTEKEKLDECLILSLLLFKFISYDYLLYFTIRKFS